MQIEQADSVAACGDAHIDGASAVASVRRMMTQIPRLNAIVQITTKRISNELARRTSVTNQSLT